MDAAMLTLGVLAVAAFLFATEIIPLAVTAMGAAIALGLLGVLTPAQVFSGLSNSTVVLFAGMFIIGAAMFQTGLAQKIGIAVVKKSGNDGGTDAHNDRSFVRVLEHGDGRVPHARGHPDLRRRALAGLAAADGTRGRGECRRYDHDDRHSAEHSHERDARRERSHAVRLL